jgi:outer membrane protein assembly factor BamD
MTPAVPRALLLLALALLVVPLAGCFATRAVGLGPAPDPALPQKGDTPEEVYAKAQRLFEAQRWADAADAFEDMWRDHPDHALANDAQFYEAESRYGQEKFYGAFQRYKAYLKKHPLSPHAPLVQQRLFDMGRYTVLKGERGLLGIFTYAEEGVEMLEYLVEAFPHGDLADDALHFVAEYELRAFRPQDAVLHLHELVESYPGSEWALSGRLLLARAYRDLNRGAAYDGDALKRSIAQYKAYIDIVSAVPNRAREYEDALQTARAELAEAEEVLAQKALEAADFYLRTGRPTAARQELENVTRELPGSAAAAEARRRLGTAPHAVPDGGEGSQ